MPRTSILSLLGAAAALLIALGLSDPDGRGRFLTDLTTALLSWPLALIIVALYLRPEISRALAEVGKRLADRTQPFSVSSPIGGFAMGGLPPVVPQAEVIPPETATPEGPLPAQDGTPTEGERARYFEELAKQWHFAFLAQVLQPQTIAVLRWLESREPMTEVELWLEWGRSIPDIREQGAILRALLEAGVVERDSDGKLAVTPYGGEFSEWQLRESWRPRRGLGGNPPFTAYGTGAEPGAIVSALVRNMEVATVTVGQDGFWMMQIPEGQPFPRDGDIIHFHVNGAPSAALEIWRAGGAPRDAGRGVSFGPGSGE